MSESNWTPLRRHFLVSYKDLRKWLTRRFGSADLAADVLHDTYLRLERGGELGPVANPGAYLQRMAENIGRNARRRDSRLLSPTETEAFFQQAVDESPHTSRIVEARQEVAMVRTVLLAMPPRRRHIFLAAWVDDVPHPEIARRMGLSLRRVQKEAQKAREQVRLALREKRQDEQAGEGRIPPSRVSNK